MKSKMAFVVAGLAAGLLVLGCGGAQEDKTLKDRILEEEASMLVNDWLLD